MQIIEEPAEQGQHFMVSSPSIDLVVGSGRGGYVVFFWSVRISKVVSTMFVIPYL